LSKLLDKILGTILEILMVIMVLVVILQVLARYAIKIPIPWTEESARYMLAYMTFVGSAIALREGKHIVVHFLYERLPSGYKRSFDLLFHVLILLFLLAILWGGLKLIEGAWDVPTASMPWFTMGQIYLILPVGLVIMIWYEMGLLWEGLKGRKADP
jgi:TRAP-type C4-dicarboxylate transport system permease small subunit